MNKNTKSKGSLYLKYIIPVVIALLVGLFFLFRSGPEKKIEREAEKRIEALKGKLSEPIDLERADHFVAAQTVISKKDRRIITTTPEAILKDLSVDPKSEIKVLIEEEKTIITTPRELLKNRTIHPDTPIYLITEGGLVTETTPRKLLADPSITLDTPIKILEKVEKVAVTTPEELQKRAPSPETPIRVIVEKPGETITLSQLLPEEMGLREDTFYIHSVTREDVQGIWGIIQHGLMDQFLKGIPMDTEGGFPEEKFLTLEIPQYADEPEEEGYSSFLGKILVTKTRESYVYNYTSGRMGKNPDYIFPGQELVISPFSNNELVQIYKHFSKNT
ncbi:MAG: hypothetical protein JSW70_02125 [Syntrophobacterales bacterium]|nr:MAG: hypothetical protein JSW70_02125 [Syntrophobacterales bacterium]